MMSWHPFWFWSWDGSKHNGFTRNKDEWWSGMVFCCINPWGFDVKLKSPVKSHGSRYLSGQVSMLCFAIHVIMLKLVTQPRFKPLKPRVLDSSKSPFIDDCCFFLASPIHRCCWSNPNRLGIGFYCIPILLGKNFNKKSRKHIWNGPHKMEVRQFHWWSTFWTCLFTLCLHHPSI